MRLHFNVVSEDMVKYWFISFKLTFNRRFFYICDIQVGLVSKKEYQLGENPPPEGAHTGINKQEIIEPVRDDSNEMEQIQHRYF